MKNDMRDFEEFMKRREDASRAFVNGDAKPLDEVATHTSPATIFGPKGDYVEGADEVNAANERGAEFFDSGSETNFEILQMSADDNLAYGQAFSGRAFGCAAKANQFRWTCA